MVSEDISKKIKEEGPLNSVIPWSAEGGAASQAVATAAAKALSEGGEPAIAVARAFAYAIAIFSCPGVKPIIYSAF